MNNLKSTTIFSTKDVGIQSDSFQDKPLKLRTYQEQAVKITIDNKCSAINIPTGAGKTHVALASFLLKKKENPNLRAIIAVPQNDIGENFKKIYSYNLLDNFYEINKAYSPSGQNDESKIKQFKKWIESYDFHKNYLQNNKYLADYQDAIVISHQLLIKIYNEFKNNSIDNELINNLFIVIDEAHHVGINPNKDITNELAKSLLFFLEKGASVQTLTATEFRKEGITLSKFLKDFETYTISIDQTIPYTNIKSITLNLIFGNDTECIKTIYTDFKDSLKLNVLNHSIIFLPNSNTQAMKNGAAKFTPEIKNKKISEIIENLPDSYKDSVISVTGNDAASDEYYKNLFDENHVSAKTTKVVIAQNKMKEGTDWIYNDTVIILGLESRGSSSDLVQMIGRALRNSKENEKNVNIFLQANPRFVLTKSEDEIIEASRQYVKYIVLAMLAIIDVLPVNDFKIPSDKENTETSKKEYSEKDIKINEISNEICAEIFVENHLKDLVGHNIEEVDKIISSKVDKSLVGEYADLKEYSSLIKEKVKQKLQCSIALLNPGTSFEDLNNPAFLKNELKSIGKVLLASSEPLSSEELEKIKKAALDLSREGEEFIEKLAAKWKNIKLNSSFRKSDKMIFECENCNKVFKRNYNSILSLLEHAKDDSSAKKSPCLLCNDSLNQNLKDVKNTFIKMYKHKIDWEEFSANLKKYTCKCEHTSSFFEEDKKFFLTSQSVCPLCSQKVSREK